MNKHITLKRLTLLWVSGLLLWAAASAQAQNAPNSVRASRDCDDNVIVDWSAVPGVSSYSVSISGGGSSGERRVGSTAETSFSLGKLNSDSYNIYVDTDQGTWGTTEARLRMSNCPEFVPPPPHFNCADIPHRMILNAIGTGTNCQTVVPGGIGHHSLIGADVLDAIDIWGSASTVQFCFRQQGRLVFIDTTVLARVVSNLAAEYIDGMTCGSVDGIGMVVLLGAGETPADTQVQSAAPAIAEAVSDEICQLTTTGYLSLRAGPSVLYERLDAMPIGTRLRAVARNGAWFLVEYDGQSGWSSGQYLSKSAGCDAIGESDQLFLSLQDEPISAAGEAPQETPAQPAAAAPGADEIFDCSLTAGDIINLRAEPGTEHTIVAEIPFLTQLIAEERWGDWFKVEYEGSMGWVNIDYVFRRGACG